LGLDRMISVAFVTSAASRSLLAVWVLVAASAARAAVRDPEKHFFDLDGNLVARYTGATRDAQEFRWLGEYVVGDGYRETSFTRYELERRKAAESKYPLP